MKSRFERGNVLLVTMIALAVLTVIVAGAIQLSGNNRNVATVQATADQTAACADSARRYLISQFRVYGMDPTTLVLNTKLPDDPSPSKQTQLMTAHYSDATGGSVAIADVKAVPASFMGNSKNTARDLANTTVRNLGLGGTYYNVVVKCMDANKREQEVEFLFRYGL